MMELLTNLNVLLAFREERTTKVPSDIQLILNQYSLENIDNQKLLSQIEYAEMQIRDEIKKARSNNAKFAGPTWMKNETKLTKPTIDLAEKRSLVLADYEKWRSQYDERYANPNNHRDRASISFGGEISFESDLPMPWVKYPPLGGIVCAFADSETGPFFACECSREPLKNNLRLVRLKNISRLEGTIDSDWWNWSVNEAFWFNSDLETIDLDAFEYVPAICHQCLGILPQRFTSEYRFKGRFEYTGNTKSFNSWWTYELQEYIRAGFELQGIFGDYVLEDQLDSEIRDLMPHALDKTKHQSYRSAYISQIAQVLTNRVRADFNLPAYGHGSQGELNLFLLVKSMFPAQPIFRNIRPAWLNGLELDMYLPEISLAFEYQGQQHFTPISHWGGEEALEKTKLRDHKKIKLCQQHQVKLVHINHDDPLDKDFIRYKMNK
jgi:hypothetical protein